MRGSHARTLLAGALLTATLLLQASLAAAATQTVTYQISGAEVAAMATRGTFTGVASAADDYGTWWAVVDHTAFDASRNAVITGGTFSLDGIRRDVTGNFVSGTVALISAASECGNEVFDVDGQLRLGRGLDGKFSATLTHYRAPVWGACVTYSATVSGVVTLEVR
jgi:hypothetical protein